MEKRGVDLIGGIVVFFVLLFVYTKFLGPIPFSVNSINTNNQTPFEVTGTGSAAGAPDKALLSLGITETASSILDAQSKANQKAEAIISSLKRLGIDEEDIKTSNYSINPNYDFSANSQRITGYTVSQNFEVETPIDKANKAIDGSTQAGANLVGNVSFALDDDKKLELENEARKEAVDMAKKSAEGLAKASGIKLGKIINVRENFGGAIPRAVMMEAKDAIGGVPENPTNITPGESKIEVNVTLTYQTN
ncbi:MAG: hypothetical protein ACD_37C00580G0006 [uncultured bacterium]|nr:MAG: hypothetical protein ACD_37C00580G0006 [uncultured bacterium]